MTGLDVDTDHIIEMACLVTDSQLSIVAEVSLYLCTGHFMHKHSTRICLSFKTILFKVSNPKLT